MGSHTVLDQKLLKTQCGVDRWAHKSPVMKWANVLRVFKKNPLKPNAASHSSASWSTDADGLLEPSPGGRGSLCYKGLPSRREPWISGVSPHMCRCAHTTHIHKPRAHTHIHTPHTCTHTKGGVQGKPGGKKELHNLM